MIIDEHPIPQAKYIFRDMKALNLNTPTHGLIRLNHAVYVAANIYAIWQRHIKSAT